MDHLCCLSGFTLTTFTLALPISPQRISTRRCQSHCSYSRGALRSTQCAPVCTTLLSTMPCQWVYTSFCFCLAALLKKEKKKKAFSDQWINWWEERNRKGGERDRWSEIHTSLTPAKACRTDFMKGLATLRSAVSTASLCTRKPSLPASSLITKQTRS